MPDALEKSKKDSKTCRKRRTPSPHAMPATNATAFRQPEEFIRPSVYNARSKDYSPRKRESTKWRKRMNRQRTRRFFVLSFFRVFVVAEIAQPRRVVTNWKSMGCDWRSLEPRVAFIGAAVQLPPQHWLGFVKRLWSGPVRPRRRQAGFRSTSTRLDRPSASSRRPTAAGAT